MRRELWPGTRPYAEHEYYLFFGRRQEIGRMVDGTFDRILVVSAESGCGKSSILAAGYIAEMRRKRAVGLNVPPLLLMRQWGAGQVASAPAQGPGEDGARDWARDASVRLIEAARDAVLELPALADKWEAVAADVHTEAGRASATAAKLRADAADLLARLPASPGENPSESWAALCGKDGIIVVLDQVEELMGSATTRSDPEQARAAVAAIGCIFRDLPKVRIVIALRSEYCRTLQRLLNRYVPNLDRRIMDLAPLAADSIREVVEGPCKARGIGWDPGFVEFIEEAADGTVGGDSAGDGSSEPDSDLGFSTLRVQALLKGYQTSLDTDQPVVSLALLHRYVSSLFPAGALGSPAQASAKALADSVRDRIQDAVRQGAGPVAEERARLAAWMFADLVPELSTQGGFKQHVQESEIYLKLLRKLLDGAQVDKTPLTTKEIERESGQIRTWLAGEGKGALVFPAARAELSGIGLKVTDQRPDELGRADAGALATVALPLMKGLLELLSQQGGVLKCVGSGANRAFELVHDGLAMHVRSWAEKLNASAEWTLGSPIPLVGLSFEWTSLTGPSPSKRLAVHGVNWRGCVVTGADFVNVDFLNCILNGMLFKNCHFQDVSFQETQLKAAIFLGAKEKDKGGHTFESSPDRSSNPTAGAAPDQDSAVEFRSCQLQSTAFEGCSFAGDATFTGRLGRLGPSGIEEVAKEAQCDLSSASFRRCMMGSTGKIRFSECILRFAQFDRFNATWTESTQGRPPQMEFERCDMMNAWVWDAGFSKVKIDESCQTIGMGSFEPPGEAWLARAPVLRPGS